MNMSDVEGKKKRALNRSAPPQTHPSLSLFMNRRGCTSIIKGPDWVGKQKGELTLFRGKGGKGGRSGERSADINHDPPLSIQVSFGLEGKKGEYTNRTKIPQLTLFFAPTHPTSIPRRNYILTFFSSFLLSRSRVDAFDKKASSPSLA